MQRNLTHKRKKNIRRLSEEYADLSSAAWYLAPPKRVRKAKILDESEIPEEKRNVKLARSLLNEGVGGKPQPLSIFELKQAKRWGRSEESAQEIAGLGNPGAHNPPFTEIRKETYCRSPMLHSYYGRDYRYEEGKGKTDPKDTYSLLHEYHTGWSYLAPVVKPRFSPEARARREEIRRRVVEISGMEFRAAVLSVREDSTRLSDYARRRREKRESIRKATTEKLVEKAYITLLDESRGDRHYSKTSLDSCGPQEGPTQEGLPLEVEEEIEDHQIEEYQREAKITIAEKVDHQV